MDSAWNEDGGVTIGVKCRLAKRTTWRSRWDGQSLEYSVHSRKGAGPCHGMGDSTTTRFSPNKSADLTCSKSTFIFIPTHKKYKLTSSFWIFQRNSDFASSTNLFQKVLIRFSRNLTSDPGFRVNLPSFQKSNLFLNFFLLKNHSNCNRKIFV